MKRNKPLEKSEVENLKKGDYAHRNPNRRTRRYSLRNPPKPVRPVDNGGGITVSRGNDLGTPWPVAGRKPTSVGEQTLMALSSVYGFFSRLRHLLAVYGGRLWVMVMDTVHSVFGRG